MSKRYQSTAPRPYRCALNPEASEHRAVYQVWDNDLHVSTFRNKVLAERCSEANGNLTVREIKLGG